MTTRISLPSALARHTGGNSNVTTAARSLYDALSDLTEQYSLGDVLLNEDGSLQPYIRVVIDNSMLSKTALQDLTNINISDKEVELKTAFAGG